ncbi:MAG: PAS-domain containing protein [Caulobacteraceae bacterium]
MILAYLYFLTLRPDARLGQLGFISVAASAQLVPSLVGAVFWRRGHARGAIWGLVTGMTVWLTVIVAPEYLDYDVLPAMQALHWRVSFEVGVLLSLGLNTVVYVALSMLAKPGLTDRIQALAFMNLERPLVPAAQAPLFGTLGDLRVLLEQFLGREDGHRAFVALNRERRRKGKDSDPVDPQTARAVERMLAGAIGASSARGVISLTLAHAGRDPADVSEILDQAAQAVHFRRELLHATLESLDQGIVVVDRELRLVAWNNRYLSLFELAPAMVFIGQSFEEIVRHSAANGGEAASEIERIVKDRLDPIVRREAQMRERDWPNGLTLKIVGAPIANGDYVISFTDVSELKSAARALAQANDQLEQRVAARTSELTAANAELAEAKAQAERMTNSQARFVAAASHDLLQPLHAARLFLGAANEDLAAWPEIRDLLAKADLSIDAADRMLRALLNLSRLEVHGVQPEFKAVDITLVLDALRREFEPTARERRLRFRVLAGKSWVRSDPDLLRSVLQNLIGNAVRYTPTGGTVLVCCRHAGDDLRIEIRDSGPASPRTPCP